MELDILLAVYVVQCSWYLSSTVSAAVAFKHLFSAAAKKKPSSCVQEVAKIKQKRDERRAAQQALRVQQDAEYDTTAPNWEFEAMIRFVAL